MNKKEQGVKMRIGIDIDDTTLITVTSMIKYADKYDIEVLGHTGTNGNLGLIENRYYLKILYGWGEETKFSFFAKYYKDILEECIPYTNAPEIIRKMKKEGHEIYFITARLTNIKNCDAERITINTFKKYNIPYDKLIVNAKEKYKYCLENNIDLFIEDSYETCKELESKGIKTILMTTKMNENIKEGSITRVKNWDEIYKKVSEWK